MANAPSRPALKVEDYPSSGLSDTDSLTKFFSALNSFGDQVVGVLDGGVTFGQNCNFEVKTVTFQTPATDPNVVYASYVANGSTTLPNGAFTTINFDTKEVDTDSAVTTGAGWQFKCPAGKGGLYRVSTATSFTGAAAATDCVITVFKSGAEIRRGARYSGTPISPFVLAATVSTELVLAANDTIQVKLYQNSGASRITEPSSVCSWIQIERVNTYGFTPAALSCFPLSVSCGLQNIAGVFLINLYDTTGGVQIPTALGGVHHEKTTTGYQVLNLPGLVLNRKYTATLVAVGG